MLKVMIDSDTQDFRNPKNNKELVGIPKILGENTLIVPMSKVKITNQCS